MVLDLRLIKIGSRETVNLFFYPHLPTTSYCEISYNISGVFVGIMVNLMIEI